MRVKNLVPWLGSIAEEYTLPAGSTTEGLCYLLGLEWDRTALVVVNGRVAPREQRLRDGDEIVLLAPISGGSGGSGAKPGWGKSPESFLKMREEYSPH